VVDSGFSVTPSKIDGTGKVRVETRDGLKWEIPPDYPGAWAGLLDHEPIVRDFLQSHFHPGKVFIDVGANVGAYSLRAAGRGMLVVAFEPNPENARVLRRNAEINNLPVDLQEFALGSSTGDIKMSLTGPTSRITDEDGVLVAMRTLDSFKLDKADLLKVDVEGHELDVIEGAVDTLRRLHPRIMVEMHHWVGAEKEAALFDILSGLGYRFEYLDRFSVGRHLTASYGD
jgi:FkbM family methyltransferase